jgi:hypothetical protein
VIVDVVEEIPVLAQAAAVADAFLTEDLVRLVVRLRPIRLARLDGLVVVVVANVMERRAMVLRRMVVLRAR